MMSEPLSRAQKLYFVLGALFIACLVVGDIIGGAKIVELGHVGDWPVRFAVGMIAFPLTFVITDLLNDFYGPRATRFLSYVGLGMLAVTFGILLAASALPAAEKTTFPVEWFDGIFGGSLRLIVASMTAYFVGQLLDIYFFGVLKRLARGRYLWLRATGSTLLSQLVDSVIVSFVLFWGTMSVREIWVIVANSYVLKFVIAIAMTPVIYLGHGLMHRYFALQPLPVAPEREGAAAQ